MLINDLAGTVVWTLLGKLKTGIKLYWCQRSCSRELSGQHITPWYTAIRKAMYCKQFFAPLPRNDRSKEWIFCLLFVVPNDQRRSQQRSFDWYLGFHDLSNLEVRSVIIAKRVGKPCLFVANEEVPSKVYVIRFSRQCILFQESAFNSPRGLANLKAGSMTKTRSTPRDIIVPPQLGPLMLISSLLLLRKN